MLKRRSISLFSLAVLLLTIMSWPPQRGLLFDNPRQIKLLVKDTGDSNSALWVRNLSARSTKLAIGINSESAQELSYLSEPVAGRSTVRLDKSLPADLRGNDLLIHSDEQLAMLVAPAELPIDESEFYRYPQPQENIEASAVPKWVLELRAIGKSGENVLKADQAGYAPAIIEKSENAKHYMFGVGLALRRANSSAEVKLISKAGQLIKTLTLTGPAKLHWRVELGEFISGTDDFPGRIEINVFAGKAQGFLSIKDLETSDTRVLPIVPMIKKQGGIQVMAAGLYGGGYGSFTSTISCPNVTYCFVIQDAPPNTCGTLKLVRNGVFQATPNWICTDSTGAASRCWSVFKTETVQSVRVEWPDGTRTSGSDTHIDDNTPPNNIQPNQSGGIGVPIPSSFTGVASDTQWGSGIRSVYGTFRNQTTQLFWNGSSYSSPTERRIYGTMSPSSGGFNITWSITPPPPSAHNPYDTYLWCAKDSDACFTSASCITFHGPR